MPSTFQGPSWNGRSGVHSHMTNTRITDPEVLERRYPIILTKFCLRENSGGDGEFKGGNGVIRELLFRAPITLSILTERRVFQPYGLAGKFCLVSVSFNGFYLQINFDET